MTIEFFMPMIPPTATHQEKQVRFQNGKGRFYEPPEVKAARAKLEAHLAQHRPERMMKGAIQLVVKWLFPIPPSTKHYTGEYKTTKPDTDNLEKLLKDVMTKLGFWKDDAQVASEIIEKFYGETPGIYILAKELADS